MNTSEAIAKTNAKLNKLNEICSDALAPLGLEVVDLEFLAENGGQVLRVFIDFEYTGEESARAISLDDCVDASRQLNTVLDVEDPISAAYRLEVSSPGVNRRLKKKKDFIRFTGKAAKVKLNRTEDRARANFKGVLTGVKDDVVQIDVDGESFDLPLADIAKANLIIEGNGTN